MSKLVVFVKEESWNPARRERRDHVLLRQELDVFDLAERTRDLARRVGDVSASAALLRVATEVAELVRDEIIESVAREAAR